MEKKIGILISAFSIFFSLITACSGGSSSVGDTDEQVSNNIQVFNVYTDQIGIYEIDEVDLKSAGINIDEVEPQKIKLFHRGDEQRLWVISDEETTKIRFYGTSDSSRYVKGNVYQLWLGGDDRNLDLEHDESDDTPDGYNSTRGYCIKSQYLGENLLYFPQVQGDDHWFWETLIAPNVLEINLEIANLHVGGSIITIKGWSTLQTDSNNQHQLIVSANDEFITNDSWSGSGWFTREIQLNEGFLLEGENTIHIEAPGEGGETIELFRLDQIELKYPVVHIANDGHIYLNECNFPIQIQGFRGLVDVYELTYPDEVSRIMTYSSKEGGILIKGEDEKTYFAVGSDGYLSPSQITRIRDEIDLFKPNMGADYLAIGPDELLIELQPLIKFRESQGMHTLSIPVQLIYDQFGDGLEEPDAIKKFLEYSYSHWDPHPRYVLLVGDGSYDPLGNVSSADANQLPTFFLHTEYGGETASDVFFAELNGDNLPDISIGRIPARQPDDVQIFVEKTLEYESMQVNDENARVLAIADGQDSTFREEAQLFLDQLQSLFYGKLISPEMGMNDVNDQIISEINDGYSLVSYFGHGSVTMWGKDRLFSVDDVNQLSNSKYPIVLNMTCLTGLFTHPNVNSLSERLLFHRDGGAVAILAPTSLTLPNDQSFLSYQLAGSMINNSSLTLGDVLLNAQREIPVDSQGVREVMFTFLLFGDPALSLKFGGE
jgi:hypothetical protein